MHLHVHRNFTDKIVKTLVYSLRWYCENRVESCVNVRFTTTGTPGLADHIHPQHHCRSRQDRGWYGEWRDLDHCRWIPFIDGWLVECGGVDRQLCCRTTTRRRSSLWTPPIRD